MTYFGTRLSENISRREPEGYLICLNVPVARSGAQDYLPSELGLPEPDSRLIPVLRPESEVFAPACIASFEGMPVTDDHPSCPEGVTAENIRRLQKGHAHNVRKGSGSESDLLLADLIITDPVLIEEILSGKREISCGYNYTLCEEDGQFIQREIRGNHVAVVEAGRAGPRVSIRDQEPSGKPIPLPASRSSPDSVSVSNDLTFERRTCMKKKSLWRAKLLTRMARDGDVEGLAEVISEMLEDPAPAEAVAAPVPAAPDVPDPLVSAVMTAVAENLDEDPAPSAPVVVETPVDQPVLIDCGPQILEALQRIISLLSGPGSADCGPESQDCDPDHPTGDENPTTPALSAAETLTETAAAAAEEAAAALGLAAEDPASLDEDPVEVLVAEILEGDGDDNSETGPDPDPDDHVSAEAEIISSILEPEEASDVDEDDPEAASRAADVLRAALASFRPQLKRMTPRERQRFNADVAARLKQLTHRQNQNGRPNAYAALRKSGAHDASGRSLGRKIMASRNANLRK